MKHLYILAVLGLIGCTHKGTTVEIRGAGPQGSAPLTHFYPEANCFKFNGVEFARSTCPPEPSTVLMPLNTKPPKAVIQFLPLSPCAMADAEAQGLQGCPTVSQ